MDINSIETGSVILMSGDSVTDCGRARPYGTYFYGLGNGYVMRLHEMLTTIVPEKMIKLVNAGISGETSRQVRERWISDIETTKPDYATLMIGINDIWRKYDTYMDSDRPVYIDEYEDNLRYIIESSKKALKGFMLIAPFYLETNHNDIFMTDVIQYSGVCKKLSVEYNIDFCDLQPDLDRIMKSLYTTALSSDRVHPNGITHFAIARQLAENINLKI